MTNQAIDLAPARETPEAFAERLCGVIDAGARSVMISVGHVSGLFDVMASMEPATSDDIATRAGLADRYVREWLAVMVMADIVDYDPFAKAYHLPPERAAFLTRAASPDNIAVYAQMVPLVGAAQDRLLECLRTGEGTRYSDYPCMHQVMEEDSGQTVVARLFDSVLPLVQGIEGRLEKGIDVLDAGCGRGRALIEMARRYPASRLTCAPMPSSTPQRAYVNWVFPISASKLSTCPVSTRSTRGISSPPSTRSTTRRTRRTCWFDCIAA